MPKTTNDNISEKLQYIGLDLNNIPEKMKEIDNLEFRPSKIYDEKYYKVYKYIDVNEIQILLTPTNRLSDIVEKYTKASPIYSYLDAKKEENIEKCAHFLKMLEDVQINEIEELRRNQQELSKNIPFKVKYNKDYLWQIYYSEFTNKYFMLVPTKDMEFTAFFYLLKSQLENNKQKIYVPICYTEQSRNYLTKSELEDMENYLWFFTKSWPLIFDVYDKSDNESIQICGETEIFENITSDYKTELNSKEDTIKFYKNLKALFILQTELPHYYKFLIKINNNGGLEFYNNEKNINFENLAQFIKEEYLKAIEEGVVSRENKINLEKKLRKLKDEANQLELEYLYKERHISTYLECKRSFIGRVKYFLKYKNITSTRKKVLASNKEDNTNNSIKYYEHAQIKDFYTLEELITLYKKNDEEIVYTKNLKLDVEALTNKNKIIRRKIENASLYIDEIDKHKKSIFEFWRFANKDENLQLTEGEIQHINTKKIESKFDLVLDFEDFAKKTDKEQRNNLSKKEQDSIYLTTTDVINDLNLVCENSKITEERIIQIKEEEKRERTLLNKDGFDVFGSISGDITKIKTLSNKKHREIGKSKFSILDINQNTKLEDLTIILKNNVENINKVLAKVSLNVSLSLFKATLDREINSKFNIFHINAQEAIEELKESDIKEFNLYKLNINRDTPAIACTNIIYFDNTNQTLPLGMDVSDKVLIDKSFFNFNIKSKFDFNIVTYQKEKVIIKKVNVFEY